jgi:hypothetical protein
VRLPADAGDIGHQLVRRLGIQPRGGLVEVDEPRVGHQSARDEQLLLHALREALDALPAPAGEAEHVEQLVGARPRRRRVHAVETPERRQVLPSAQPLVEVGVRLYADLRSNRLSLVSKVMPEHLELGDRGRIEDAVEDANGGGLACAVGAEEAEHGTARDGEVDRIERDQRAERPGQPADLYRRPVDLPPRVRHSLQLLRPEGPGCQRDEHARQHKRCHHGPQYRESLAGGENHRRIRQTHRRVLGQRFP